MSAWTFAAIASFAVCCFGCCILRSWVKGVPLVGAAMVAAFMGVLSLGCCRCFSCHAWHVPTCRTPPGEGGVARCKGGVYPPLEREPKADRKGRSAAEVCTSEARKTGEALAPREGSALRKA